MLGLDIGRNRELIALALPCSAKSSNCFPIAECRKGGRLYKMKKNKHAKMQKAL